MQALPLPFIVYPFPSVLGSMPSDPDTCSGCLSCSGVTPLSSRRSSFLSTHTSETFPISVSSSLPRLPFPRCYLIRSVPLHPYLVSMPFPLRPRPPPLPALPLYPSTSPSASFFISVYLSIPPLSPRGFVPALVLFQRGGSGIGSETCHITTSCSSITSRGSGSVGSFFSS